MTKLNLVIRFLAVIATVIVCINVWDHYRHPKFLSFLERLRANIIWESHGLDGIRCVKLKVEKERYFSAIENLNLSPSKDYPDFAIKIKANCYKVDWWDVDFPHDSQHFWMPSEGMGERVHTAYVGNYLYYSYEIN